ncbi:hypothetical protein ACFV6F_35980 [Kitasatospora phosalacinea]|uniref:hypothetical protein n=1 Tax=Kitasatospora phosalacinea TaxID=2065 RepID=UPI00366791B6
MFRQEDGVTIAKTYGIDLDASEAESKDWRYSQGVAGKDLYYWYVGQLHVEYLEVPAAPDRAACERTGYSNDGMSADQVVSGTTLCVKTSAGKLARVVIRQVNPGENGSLVLDILVWQK